ncbi:hypothetical protein [Methylobacterium bullatum]|uniref:hypothetical protein n=1 Tax=Methylobacterium bullatum TaxID=570505 RepID=UPI0037CA9394
MIEIEASPPGGLETPINNTDDHPTISRCGEDGSSRNIAIISKVRYLLFQVVVPLGWAVAPTIVVSSRFNNEWWDTEKPLV